MDKYFALLAACNPSDYVREDATTDHSPFTAGVWDGLTGKAAGSNGQVTPASLSDFVAGAMAAAGAETKPYFSGKGDKPPALAKAERCILPMTGKRSAICIGISQYKDPSICAPKRATRDAENIFNVMTKGASACFDGPLSFLYCDGQATRKTVYDAVYNLRYILARGDVLVVYFAGNTCLGRDGNPVLLCWDTEMKNYEFTGLGMKKLDEIFDSLPCDIVMLMDTSRIASVTGR